MQRFRGEKAEYTLKFECTTATLFPTQRMRKKKMKKHISLLSSDVPLVYTGCCVKISCCYPPATHLTLSNEPNVTINLFWSFLSNSVSPAPGGYYLTSLYASLFYISSFRSRVATRQLSAEAQKSLSQWHRRRTLHCNQSRRSRNRRTIRRHKSCDKVEEDSEEENTSASKDKAGEWTHAGDVTETLQTLAIISGEEKEKQQNGGSED